MNIPGRATLAELARLIVENANLKGAIERAYHELNTEEVDPDQCRYDVLSILRPFAVPQKGVDHE
jgi:hypothetical protein